LVGRDPLPPVIAYEKEAHQWLWVANIPTLMNLSWHYLTMQLNMRLSMILKRVIRGE
jgi:hypothetical protein